MAIKNLSAVELATNMAGIFGQRAVERGRDAPTGSVIA